MNKVLVLGAGLVAKPLVQYLLNQPDTEVMVASRTVSKADKLVDGHPMGKTLSLNVNDREAVSKLISEHDVSISLLPWQHHLTVAGLCLEHKKHLVTTSYVKPEMAALDEECRKNGLLFLNEIGVDPGIDHMSAMRVVNNVWDNGGKVVSFRSYCGGLPSLEANTNPFGYKFSWSPKGVILAATNPAKYMVDGEIVNVESEKLFDDYHFLDVPGLGTYEAYPNRDSMPYIETYGFKAVKTMFRGTLRNVSHCEAWKNMVLLGLFDDAKQYDLSGKTAVEFLKENILNLPEDDPAEAIRGKLNLRDSSVFMRKFKWLGYLDKTPLTINEGTACDVLTDLMFQRLSFEEGERDLIILHHEFKAEYPDKKEFITSTLIDEGIPGGDSAMSRTVALPAAIATAMLLKKEINLTGVKVPVDKEVYIPVLKELERLGIECKEVYKSV